MANLTFTMKVGDNAPPLAATLSSGVFADRDLSGTTVTVRLWLMPRAGSPENLSAEVVDPVARTVRYEWPTPQARAPGLYQGEWHVTWSDGMQATFPNDQYFFVLIVDDLMED